MEAVVAANHRALEGDPQAGLHPDDFRDALPLAALTCIDVRLNRLLPNVLGLRADDFIWLRNAGNIIFDPMSSMMRTLALACAVKGGREIAIIGHSDCKVRHISTSELIDRFRSLGVERSRLPENLTEFFGLFASEHQNVVRGVDITRSSPLIGPRIPVHGLLVDVGTGRIDWVVNGYDRLSQAASAPLPASTPGQRLLDAMPPLPGFHIGDINFPEMKIGEARSVAETMIEKVREEAGSVIGSLRAEAARIDQAHEQHAADPPPKIPIPPPIRLAKDVQKGLSKAFQRSRP